MSELTQDEINEKEQAIARRLGWTLVHNGCGVSPDPRVPAPSFIPAYFTDRDASAEIVEWFANSDKWLEFSDLVTWNWNHDNNNSDKMIRATSYVFIGLRATPRQIAEAALAVWGIEEGEAK